MTLQETQKAIRVRNLIAKSDREKMSLKRWAVLKLLDWQPLAQKIRFEGPCHCRGTHRITYQLPSGAVRYQMNYTMGMTGEQPQEGAMMMESCGVYCPSCEFSGASWRESK